MRQARPTVLRFLYLIISTAIEEKTRTGNQRQERSRGQWQANLPDGCSQGIALAATCPPGSGRLRMWAGRCRRLCGPVRRQLEIPKFSQLLVAVSASQFTLIVSLFFSFLLYFFISNFSKRALCDFCLSATKKNCASPTYALGYTLYFSLNFRPTCLGNFGAP